MILPEKEMKLRLCYVLNTELEVEVWQKPILNKSPGLGMHLRVPELVWHAQSPRLNSQYQKRRQRRR